MRAREFLNEARLFESTGLTGRKQGDKFTDGKNTLYFSQVVFFPESGQFEAPEDMTTAIEDYTREWGDPTWVNNRTGRAKAFGIAEFTDDAGNTHHYGRFFQSIDPNFRNNNWKNSFAPGWQYDSKAAKKEKSGFQPSEILTQYANLSPANLLEQIRAKFGDNHSAYKAAKLVEAGAGFPIRVPAMPDVDVSAFSNYFCELLHPLALISGNQSAFKNMNPVNKAAELCIGTTDLSGTSITFDQSKTAGLSDSDLKSSDGRKLRISSKAKQGASASTNNLIESIEDIKRLGDKKLLRRLKDTIEVIEIINHYSYKADAPIQLALKYGIINESQAREVYKLVDMSARGEVSYYDVQNNPKEYLSKDLANMYTRKGTSKPDEATAGFHMISCICYKAVDHINHKTDFPVKTVELLANAGLIQLHSYVKHTGDEWVIDPFEARFPGNYDVKVFLDGGKYYYSTGIKGRIPFMIKPESHVPRHYYVNQVDKASAKAAKDKAALEKKKSRTKANPDSRGKSNVKGAAGRKKR